MTKGKTIWTRLKLTLFHLLNFSRAKSNSDPLESKYFVVLDRLTETLEDKMLEWRKEIGRNSGLWFGPFGYCCSKKHIIHKLWIERLTVSRDVASAIRHLHHQGIVYRDLVSLRPSDDEY